MALHGLCLQFLISNQRNRLRRNDNREILAGIALNREVAGQEVVFVAGQAARILRLVVHPPVPGRLPGVASPVAGQPDVRRPGERLDLHLAPLDELDEWPFVLQDGIVKVPAVDQRIKAQGQRAPGFVDDPVADDGGVVAIDHEDRLEQKYVCDLVGIGGKWPPLEALQQPVALLGEIAVVHLVRPQDVPRSLDVKVLVQLGHQQPPVNRGMQGRHQQPVIAAGVEADDGGRGKAPQAVGQQPLPGGTDLCAEFAFPETEVRHGDD